MVRPMNAIGAIKVRQGGSVVRAKNVRDSRMCLCYHNSILQCACVCYIYWINNEGRSCEFTFTDGQHQ